MTTRAWDVASDRLSKFLGGRRWFGGKGRVIRHAALADVIPVRWPSSPREFAVARVRVTTDEATSLYQLFFVADERSADAEPAAVTEALEDADFRRGLVDAFARGAEFASADGAVRWVVASETDKPLVAPPHAGIAMSSAEQTNSSVVIDSQAILKLYRKLEPGLNPDVEITRFLTIERGFAHVPALLGTIRFDEASGATIAGMLQELVPGAIDGWRYALERAREHMSRGSTAEPPPFVQESRQLGTVTRAMHETLASGARGGPFAMHAATAATVTAWCQAARRTIAQALDTLDVAVRKQRLARHRDAAAAVVDRRAEYLELPASIARRIGADAGGIARTHGDYHLGQVLRSAAERFLIIDFEGEPARPLAERRAPQSPLRDVAGMLRSFAYAAATAGEQDPRADEWERAVRDAFVDAYFAGAGTAPGLLPASRDNVRHLLTLFEAEKVFYELQYELDHRPDWVWIPMHGIATMTEAA